jgi:hypothetical protein
VNALMLELNAQICVNVLNAKTVAKIKIQAKIRNKPIISLIMSFLTYRKIKFNKSNLINYTQYNKNNH